MNKFGCFFSKMIGLLLVWMFILAHVSAQEKHFVFIQSENKQPFYIQYNNQTFSSTASGYATLSQLVTGKYYLTIGFRKNKYSEQKFIIDVNRTDWGTGYYLKQFGEKGWGLSNIVDNSVVMADRDTFLLKQGEQTLSTHQIDTVSHDKNKAYSTTESTAGSSAQALNANNKVKKIYELTAATAVNQIYVDKSRKKADTITLVIPLQSSMETIAVVKCKSVATENDFYKTRLEMAAANSNEVMLLKAKDQYLVKCFSTEQTKNLGVLFLTEAQKFQFFEMAKEHISDPENYAELQLQFTQMEWKEKFIASLKK
jgi:hypothetical protein